MTRESDECIAEWEDADIPTIPEVALSMRQLAELSWLRLTAAEVCVESEEVQA